jgi:hypothetical protein
MGWFILKHIFSTILSIINTTQLSNQEKDLEILIPRQQLSILQRKHNSPIKPNRVEKITLAVLTARLKRITHRSAKGLATHGAEIMADIPNFTNVQPQIQIGNIVFGAQGIYQFKFEQGNRAGLPNHTVNRSVIPHAQTLPFQVE